MTGPRLLLRRLREVMAGPGTGQQKLDQVVRLIAANMVAEVCSVYVARAGDILELFATEGLRAEAVHITRLRFGEGLVGAIAASGLPLNLADAQRHPSFAYRPETGEEIYHSLMGVPIVRGGRVSGVLVVQNRAYREYSEEELEAMQTVAMVLAEIVGAGQLIDPLEFNAGNGLRGGPPHFDALRLSEGFAVGVAVFHEPRVEVKTLFADDSEGEKRRLDSALVGLKQQIDSMLEESDLGAAGEHRDVLETYRMFANDKGWRQKILDAIDSGLSAEAAVERVQTENHARMMRSTDAYLRERVTDFDDLANRLMRHLAGSPRTAAHDVLPENTILIARNMGPAELLDYDRTRVKGVVLEDGAPTSHVAILARALAIPMVGRVKNITREISPGEELILDGDGGQVFVRPTSEVMGTYQDAIKARDERLAQYAALVDQPAVTKDGIAIDLRINAGLLIDVPQIAQTGAAGIGLFRTEFQFMVANSLPKLSDQVELYSKVLDIAGSAPVIFRTLDVGGDKLLPFLERDVEENPALGWRAIRIALDRPALLRYQLRALLRAGSGRNLHVMFPMVAEVAEFRAARAILDHEMKMMERSGRALPNEVRVGTMLEVPSLAFQFGALLPLVDFISIGSNDLVQFFFACDRGNPKLAERYDMLAPALLTFIRHIVEACDRENVTVSLCGDMASRPLEAATLLALGLRRLSVSPSAVGPVKAMIQSLDLRKFSDYVLGWIDSGDHSLRAKLSEFAQDHGLRL